MDQNQGIFLKLDSYEDTVENLYKKIKTFTLIVK